MPPASWPIASIFCVWRSSSSVRRSSVMSCTIISKAGSPAGPSMTVPPMRSVIGVPSFFSHSTSPEGARPVASASSTYPVLCDGST